MGDMVEIIHPLFTPTYYVDDHRAHPGLHWRTPWTDCQYIAGLTQTTMGLNHH